MTLMEALRWVLAALIPGVGVLRPYTQRFVGLPSRLRFDEHAVAASTAPPVRVRLHHRNFLSLIDRYRSPCVIDSADASFPWMQLF